MPSRITPGQFWARVDKRGPDDCWPYQGPHQPNGYGTVGRRDNAHRRAYKLAIGPIPDGHEVDHVRARGCVRRDCCNPAHLEAVTRTENHRRRRGHPYGPRDVGPVCPQGHPRTADSMGVNINGARFCRLCARERSREHARKRRAARRAAA